MKEVHAEGRGSMWIPTGTDEFEEVSWEDALLPAREADTEGAEDGEGVGVPHVFSRATMPKCHLVQTCYRTDIEA